MDGRLHDKVCHDITSPAAHPGDVGNIHETRIAPVFIKTHHLKARSSEQSSPSHPIPGDNPIMADSMSDSFSASAAFRSGKINADSHSNVINKHFYVYDEKSADLLDQGYADVGFRVKKRAGSLVGELMLFCA